MFYDVDYVFSISPGDKEAFDYKVQIQLERLALETSAHDSDHFLGKFEIGFFELKVIGRRYVKNEPKINVYKIALFGVDEYIAIVPVLNLQDVRHYTVCSLGAYEVFSGLLEPNIVLGAEVGDKELIQALLIGLANRVTGNGLRDNLDDTSDVLGLSSPVADSFVGEKLQLQVVALEYLREETYDLQSQAVLANVIKHFVNARNLNQVVVLILAQFGSICCSRLILGLSVGSSTIKRKLFFAALLAHLHLYVSERDLLVFIVVPRPRAKLDPALHLSSVAAQILF